MSWELIIILVIGGFLLLVPLMTYLSSRRILGKRVEDERFSGDEARLLYFYSKGCAPCRGMTPIIDRLAERYGQVHKIDVAEEPRTARQYGIRATPTTLLVRQNVIRQVLLGAKSQQQLERLLEENP